MLAGSAAGRYVLLNLSACLLAALLMPYVAKGTVDVVEAIRAEDTPRLPNLLEMREAIAVRKARPTADMLAQLPSSSLPTVPLSREAKPYIELVSETKEETLPLASGLDQAESLPVKPLRPLHKPRFQALYADLAKHSEPDHRRAGVVTASSHTTPRGQRAKRRELLAREFIARNESAGSIAHRSFSNAFASLTP